MEGSATAPGMRSFDPHRLGTTEAAMWAAYYRRQWTTVLPLSVTLVREVYALPRATALRAAFLVARATRAWAPVPDNDPEAARPLLRRMFALVARRHGVPADPSEAARLEVEWWRVHRELSGVPDADDAPLVRALADKLSYVYRVPVGTVEPAARLRAEAMDLSDAWVRSGEDGDQPPEIARTLVACYTRLREAVGG